MVCGPTKLSAPSPNLANHHPNSSRAFYVSVRSRRSPGYRPKLRFWARRAVSGLNMVELAYPYLAARSARLSGQTRLSNRKVQFSVYDFCR